MPFLYLKCNEFLLFFKGDPGIMGPFGMPGASVPGPPGPKVCIHIFFFYLNLGSLLGEKTHHSSELGLQFCKNPKILFS